MLRLRSKIKVQRGKLIFGQRNRRTSRRSSYRIIGQKLSKYGAIFECRTFRNFIRQIFYSATHQSEKSSFRKNTIRQLTKGNKLFGNWIIWQLDHLAYFKMANLPFRKLAIAQWSFGNCQLAICHSAKVYSETLKSEKLTFGNQNLIYYIRQNNII